MLIICFEEKQMTIIIESSHFRSRHEAATELALIVRGICFGSVEQLMRRILAPHADLLPILT